MFSGSAIACDAAAVILLTDDFTKIVDAVEQGRLIFRNLQNVIAYMIAAGCWSELLPVLATFFLGLPTPLGSLMMIVVCVLSDTYAAVALICELPQKSLMLEKPRNLQTQPLTSYRSFLYSYLFVGNIQALSAFYNYFIYMSHRGPLHTAPDFLPSDDYSGRSYPIGYLPSQLIGAWNWASGSGDLATDQISASSVGSSVYYTTLVLAQIAHFISIRRSTPYFSDAIMNTAKSAEPMWRRVWNEFIASTPPLPVTAAIIGAIITCNFWNEATFLQSSCSTGSVPGENWGIGIGFGVIVFCCLEARKWYLLLVPTSEKYLAF